MDRQLAKFINREINSVRADVFIGRESSGAVDHITITPVEHQEPLYRMWHNPNRKQRDTSIPPKHTGGKSAYIKVAIVDLLNKDLPLDVVVAGFKLSAYIKWHSQYLEVGKGNRRRFATHKDLQRIFKMSASGVTRLVKKMKDVGIIDRDNTGYKMIGGYFIKGVQKSEDQV